MFKVEHVALLGPGVLVGDERGGGGAVERAAVERERAQLGQHADQRRRSGTAIAPEPASRETSTGMLPRDFNLVMGVMTCAF